ncbi:MAG: hypothetical protein ACI9FG_001316, partial [Crocinitomicaceae bacterium]
MIKLRKIRLNEHWRVDVSLGTTHLNLMKQPTLLTLSMIIATLAITACDSKNPQVVEPPAVDSEEQLRLAEQEVWIQELEDMERKLSLQVATERWEADKRALQAETAALTRELELIEFAQLQAEENAARQDETERNLIADQNTVALAEQEAQLQREQMRQVQLQRERELRLQAERLREESEWIAEENAWAEEQARLEAESLAWQLRETQAWLASEACARRQNEIIWRLAWRTRECVPRHVHHRKHASRGKLDNHAHADHQRREAKEQAQRKKARRDHGRAENISKTQGKRDREQAARDKELKKKRDADQKKIAARQKRDKSSQQKDGANKKRTQKQSGELEKQRLAQLASTNRDKAIQGKPITGKKQPTKRQKLEQLRTASEKA